MLAAVYACGRAASHLPAVGPLRAPGPSPSLPPQPTLLSTRNPPRPLEKARKDGQSGLVTTSCVFLCSAGLPMRARGADADSHQLEHRPARPPPNASSPPRPFLPPLATRTPRYGLVARPPVRLAPPAFPRPVVDLAGRVLYPLALHLVCASTGRAERRRGRRPAAARPALALGPGRLQPLPPRRARRRRPPGRGPLALLPGRLGRKGRRRPRAQRRARPRRPQLGRRQPGRRRRRARGGPGAAAAVPRQHLHVVGPRRRRALFAEGVRQAARRRPAPAASAEPRKHRRHPGRGRRAGRGHHRQGGRRRGLGLPCPLIARRLGRVQAL